jgi:hypothetical protein
LEEASASLFNDLGGLGFSEDEINAVNKWRDALRAFSSEGQAIVKNCELETRINDDIRKKFLKNIISKFRETNNPIDAIGNAISEARNPYKKDQPVLDPLLLKNGEISNLPQNFIRFVGYYSLLAFLMRIGFQVADELIWKLFN